MTNIIRESLVPTGLVLTFTLFVGWLYLTNSWIASIILSLLCIVPVGVAVKGYMERKELKEARNRIADFHIVGCHPETGQQPHLSRFAEYCEFVDHEDVHIREDEVSELMERANKGLDKSQIRDVRIFTYTFQEPLSKETSTEHWSFQDGENNYSQRIYSSVEKSLQRTRTAQYKADPKAYKRVELGQSIAFDA